MNPDSRYRVFWNRGYPPGEHYVNDGLLQIQLPAEPGELRIEVEPD
jgi:hypothetical protein